MTRLSEGDVQAIIELAKEAGQYLGEYSLDRRERFLDVLIERGKVCDKVDDLAADWLALRAENERLESESLALRMALDNLEESSRALLEAEFAARFDAHWDHLDEQTKAARALLTEEEKPC